MGFSWIFHGYIGGDFTVTGLSLDILWVIYEKYQNNTPLKVPKMTD